MRVPMRVPTIRAHPASEWWARREERAFAHPTDYYLS
jgi:hypothetical protein